MTELLPRYRRLSAVMVLTLGSQALSAANTLMLHFLGLSPADTYSAATQVGLAGFNGVTIGILYNIAIGRPAFRSWRVWSLVAAIVSVGSAVLQGVLFSNSGFMVAHGPGFVWMVLALFGAGGIFISLAATEGVKAACQGRPLLFASVTVYPNCGVLLGIAAGVVTGLAILPAIGWFSASVLLFIVARQSNRSEQGYTPPPVTGMSGDSDSLRSQIVGLILGVLASTLMPMFYLSALAQLPLGVVYAATLVSRIVNASVALTVNSVLLVRFNWTTRGERLGVSSRNSAVLFAILLTSALIARAAGLTEVSTNIIVICGWFFGVVASSILIRHLNATRQGRAILVKTIVEVLVTGGFAILLFMHPSFGGYFGCFAVSSGLTILAAGIVLRVPSIGIAGSIGLLSTILVICSG